jgi:phosphoglycolate phosphatase
MPKALVFDWDNTLVDTWQVIHRALAETLEAMGMRPWTLDETRRNVRASARDAFPRLFQERAEEAQRIFYESYENEHLAVLTPLPGASELLTALAGNDALFLSILSNKKGALLRRELAHLGWDHLFGAAIGALDAARDKPAHEALLAALTGSNVRPGPEVWIVGDTDIDMRCAGDHGCEAILVRAEGPSEGEFGHFEPIVWATDCRDLRQKLHEFGML